MSALIALTWQAGLLLGSADASPPPPELPVITVVSRRPRSALATPVSVDSIVPEDEQPIMAHANELLDSVPATWISRGSGQEHLTAIRSPVLTGAGACGAFLLLEDGIPIRPVGLCNVNNLFELNLERAEQVEVLRGPGSTVHGGNGLHGAIQVVMPGPESGDESLDLLLGSHSYQRLDWGQGDHDGVVGWRIDGSLQSSDSFRDAERYDQQKLNLRVDHQWAGHDVSHRLAATNLNQETAGFILGFESYADPALRTRNLNPEAFRDAHAFRLSSRLTIDGSDNQHLITAYLRSSRMSFLQHFLPGKPLEENGQDSAGLQWLWHRPGAVDLTLGADLEWAEIEVFEDQELPTVGSPFLVATRPVGRHYDFQVDQQLVAMHGDIAWQLTADYQLHFGVRIEHLRYDYDNRMADGNAREDGSVCGFGGCLYQRPGDRQDRFTEWAPKLGLSRQWQRGLIWARASSGFRPPQATELYRLQRGQQVADLNSEKLDALEVGSRWQAGRWDGSLVVFVQSKRNFIFRDASGFNVSNGRTRHRGLEWQFQGPLNEVFSLSASGTYARHTYAFTQATGEAIQSGNRVDTAPDWLARTALDWTPFNGTSLRAEWVHQGDYFIDAANAHRYGGHDLINLSGRKRLGNAWSAAVTLNNVFGKRYAERADFAFGNYRYFPGDGRRITVMLSYRG